MMKKHLLFLLFSYLFQALTAQTYQVDTINYVGDSEKLYDLMIVAEGYTESELELFRADAHKVMEVMAMNNAYMRVMDKMNIFSISTPSQESGISLLTLDPSPNDPIQEPVVKNTLFGIHFLNSYRAYFLLDSAIAKARHIAAEHNAFSDNVLILTNDSLGSGRGAFEGVAVAARVKEDDNIWNEYVINHELAHSIAGLSDAYSVYKEEGFNKSTDKNPNTIRWKEFLSSDEVGIDSIAEGVYIPSTSCMLISTDYTYCCPVCSARIEEVVSKVPQRLLTPHRIYFIGRDDEKNTMAFGWDPIPGASSYEVIFHAYWRQNVIYETTETNQITMAIPASDMEMIPSYQMSVGMRAYNDEGSTYFPRYNIDAFVYSPASEPLVPSITKMDKTSATSYLIEFDREMKYDATLIRLFNEEGQFAEIKTGEKSIELRGLKEGKSYRVQLASVNPNGYAYPNFSSPFTDLIELPNNITSIEESLKHMISIGPNPTKDILNFKMDKVYSTLQINVLNMQGQVVLQHTAQQTAHYQLDIASLTSGLYILNLFDGRQSTSFKVIKE